MVSGRRAPARWRCGCPTSRAGWRRRRWRGCDAPDDALLAAVLVKLFADRQVAVPPGLIEYLLPRIERSSRAAEAVVAALDRAGLAGHRPMTPRLAAEVLQAERGR